MTNAAREIIIVIEKPLLVSILCEFHISIWLDIIVKGVGKA